MAMRILVCANRDFMANRALNLLWPALAGHKIELVLSRGVGIASPRAQAIHDWQALEARLMEGLAYPNQKGWRSFESLALDTMRGKPYYPLDINDGGSIELLESFRPELVLSIRFGLIFKAEAIRRCGKGILNLHSGLLPQYRGIMATFWAMQNGEVEHGCTLHRISDAGIDSGGILSDYRISLDYSRSLLWNVASLYDGGIMMMANALEIIALGGTIESQDQPASGGAYYSYPQDEDVKVFSRRGGRLYTLRDYVQLLAPYRITEEAVMARARLSEPA